MVDFWWNLRACNCLEFAVITRKVRRAQSFEEVF